LVLESNRAMFE